jgi:hypothetical protein
VTRISPRATPRKALTLLEVVFAMAIFLLSMVAIWQLSTLGSDRALEVQIQARTSMRCQAKMDEVMVGAEAMNSSGYNSFTDDANKDLQWKLDATSATTTGLWTVKVSVKADMGNGRVIESQLCRMLLDPKTRGSTGDLPIPPPPPNPTPAPSTTTPTATAQPAASAPAAMNKGGNTKGGGPNNTKNPGTNNNNTNNTGTNNTKAGGTNKAGG